MKCDWLMTFNCGCTEKMPYFFLFLATAVGIPTWSSCSLIDSKSSCWPLTRIAILQLETAGLSLSGWQPAGTAFVLAREGSASHWDKYLSAVYRQRDSRCVSRFTWSVLNQPLSAPVRQFISSGQCLCSYQRLHFCISSGFIFSPKKWITSLNFSPLWTSVDALWDDQGTSTTLCHWI